MSDRVNMTFRASRKDVTSFGEGPALENTFCAGVEEAPLLRAKLDRMDENPLVVFGEVETGGVDAAGL